ncbi:MAG: GNAT family N-acetyltransferase [Ardenticatenaceae bacterium]|nr:GNAT family N-acetyltransferase [Ardenticatenaceae bacterium]
MNAGAALCLPKRKETLGERILSESAVQRMLALEPKARNHALLRLLYGGGLRVAELVSLRWRAWQARTDAGQVVVFGKGGKTRAVLLSKETWAELMTLRGPDAGPNDPVFVSQKGGALSPAPGCRTDRIGYLEAWYVDPDWRGQGVGRRLVETAEARARSVGCREMASDTTPNYPLSPGAHAALGYQEVERSLRKDLG